MNLMTLAGLGLIALSASRGRGEPIIEHSTQRGLRQRKPPRAAGKARMVVPFKKDTSPRKLPHNHAFHINGVILWTNDTFPDPKNSDHHAHSLSIPMRVVGDDGRSRRIPTRFSTSFNPYGPDHTHTVDVRGTVHSSGVPK